MKSWMKSYEVKDLGFNKLDNRRLAAKSQLVAFELGVFAGFAEESHNADHDLDGEEDDPDVHAITKAGSLPKDARAACR
jgi:hypothetical protein